VNCSLSVARCQLQRAADNGSTPFSQNTETNVLYCETWMLVIATEQILGRSMGASRLA